MYIVAGVLYFVSSTVNPILYNLMSRRYRTAFRQTIFGPLRRPRRESSRPRLGSNTTYRQAGHGDNNFHQQQRHCFLARNIRGHPQVTGSGRATDAGCGRKDSLNLRTSSRKKESPPSSSSQEGVGPAGSQLVTSPLCPNILACRRTCMADKSRQCSVAAASASQRGPCDDAPVFASDAQHKQHANVGGAADPCVHDGVTSETVATTHAPSGTNPRHSQTLQDDSRLRALHQDGVSSGVQGVCKQCLVHSANGALPQFGVIAYHGRINMKEPRTVV